VTSQEIKKVIELSPYSDPLAAIAFAAMQIAFQLAVQNERSAIDPDVMTASQLRHICETQRVEIERLRKITGEQPRGADGFGSTGTAEQPEKTKEALRNLMNRTK
jgi:hypothetical protein